MKLSARQVLWFRLRRSGLASPFASPEEAARALFGVQAQILPAAALALWNRTERLSYAEVEARLYERRSLVKLWGQRHTLHLYASDEWPLLHGALAGRKTWWERQLIAGGGDAAAYAETVAGLAALLRERETLGRSDLRGAGVGLSESLLSPWGGVFADLVRRGHACHARPESGEGRFAHRERWLPDLAWSPPAPGVAAAEVARRYLAAYGPAGARDLAYWRGATVEEAKAALAALGGEVAEVSVEGQRLLALAADLEALAAAPPPEEEWPVRLLYRFDPLLLAHKEKSWVVDPKRYSRVWRPAGHIEGVLLWRGRAAGVWRYERGERDLAVEVSSFEVLPQEVKAAAGRAAAGVAGFFGVPLRELKIRRR